MGTSYCNRKVCQISAGVNIIKNIFIVDDIELCILKLFTAKINFVP
jgi:hypothetical protein